LHIMLIENYGPGGRNSTGPNSKEALTELFFNAGFTESIRRSVYGGPTWKLL